MRISRILILSSWAFKQSGSCNKWFDLATATSWLLIQGLERINWRYVLTVCVVVYSFFDRQWAFHKALITLEAFFFFFCQIYPVSCSQSSCVQLGQQGHPSSMDNCTKIYGSGYSQMDEGSLQQSLHERSFIEVSWFHCGWSFGWYHCNQVSWCVLHPKAI